MPRNSLEISYASLTSLRDNPRSARRHSKKKIAQLAESIRKLGFNAPVLVDANNMILAGHARAAAARQVGMDEVPIVRITHLTEAEARAFVLADNKFGLNASWDFELLADELKDVIDLGFEVDITGFSIAEADLTIWSAAEAKAVGHARSSVENIIPEPPISAITRRGDVWILGRHKLLCGDARSDEDYSTLLGDELIDIVFTDPPYNVKIAGNVSGLGKVVHSEFAMASGEMSKAEFTSFLMTTLGLAATACQDGAIAFVCMDWRHAGELLAAGNAVFTELKNVCVWKKKKAGMGAFYRSQHELIFVFKSGTGPHTNTFGLGDTGRYRTNVWEYAGVNSFGRRRAEELEMHPTVKPAALVIDALKDCSKRGGLVLDPFGGSGTTLIAAEKCGRIARLIEYEPRYCDTIIARYEKVTGKQATLLATGQSYEDVAEERSSSSVGEAA
jgi:DNA modification methylase